MPKEGADTLAVKFRARASPWLPSPPMLWLMTCLAGFLATGNCSAAAAAALVFWDIPLSPTQTHTLSQTHTRSFTFSFSLYFSLPLFLSPLYSLSPSFSLTPSLTPRSRILILKHKFPLSHLIFDKQSLFLMFMLSRTYAHQQAHTLTHALSLSHTRTNSSIRDSQHHSLIAITYLRPNLTQFLFQGNTIYSLTASIFIFRYKEAKSSRLHFSSEIWSAKKMQKL